MNVRECNVTPGSTLTKVLKLITIRMLHDSPNFLFSLNPPPGYLTFPSALQYETLPSPLPDPAYFFLLLR